MATDRLPAQVIADDSNSSWRFEKPAGTLAWAVASGKFGAQNTLAVVRTDAAADAYLVLGTGGETGTTQDYYLKLDGAADNLTIHTAGGQTPVVITPAGVVTIASLTATSLTATAGSIGGGTFLTGTATWDPPSLAPGAASTTTITVTGAATTNTPSVIITPSVEVVGNGFMYYGRVTAANTVTVTYVSLITTVNLGSHTVRATVIQY